MTAQITIDPRDFIGPAFHACPNCKRREFGLLMVGHNLVTRRCRECRHTASETLPPLSKKIIYLDQMVVSNIHKALAPDWEREVDPYWLELFSKLDRLLKLQLVLCPNTTVHEQESSVTPAFEGLRRIYEYLGNGASFGFADEIHATQLRLAFGPYLDGQSFDYGTIDRFFAISGDLNKWTEPLRISVPRALSQEEIEAYERRRDETHKGLGATVTRWASEPDRGFDEWLGEELPAYHQGSLVKFLEYRRAVLGYMSGQGPLSEVVWNPSLLAMIPEPLVEEAMKQGDSFSEAVIRVEEFLQSDVGLRAPNNHISAHLLAALARKVAAGQRKVTRGTLNDVTSIATVAPYCDLLFLDDQFAGMLREEPLKSRLNLAEKTFSNRTRIEFLDRLEDMEREAPEGHATTVLGVYGESWLTPYRTILESE